MYIHLADGSDNLIEAQRQTLAIATKEDVVAVDYAVYQYMGNGGEVDLLEADFADTSLWQKQAPRFTTTGETQEKWVEIGDLVQVTIPQQEDGEPQFGVYRYVGEAAALLDLSQQDYANSDDWAALAEFDTVEGQKTLSHGAYVGQLEGLTVEVWNDVDLQAQVALTIVAEDAVSIASPGDLQVDSITAGGAVRLQALGHVSVSSPLGGIDGQLILYGSDDEDQYCLSGGDKTLDLPNLPEGQLVSVEKIDLTGTGGNTLMLDAASVMKVTGSGTLTVRGDSDDQADLGSGWTLVESHFIGTDYCHILTQGDATVRLALHPWHNPVFAVDVSGNGSAEMLDAVQVIAWINEQGIGELTSPPELPDAPPSYLDVTGNDFAEPLDVLRVVNYIYQSGSGPIRDAGPEGESASASAPAITEGAQPVLDLLGSGGVNRSCCVENPTRDECVARLWDSGQVAFRHSINSGPDDQDAARVASSPRLVADTNEPRDDTWQNLDWLDLVGSLGALAIDVTKAWGT